MNREKFDINNIADADADENNIFTGEDIVFMDPEEPSLRPDNGGKDSGKHRKKKIKPILVSALVVIFLALIASFSWYLYTTDNHADRTKVEVMTPYFLYLLNADEKSALQLSIGDIHPGEVKQVVFCVSNKKPVDSGEESTDTGEIARESKFDYDMEFIHTDNLKVEYKLYELDKSSLGSEETVPDGGIVVEGEESVYWTKKKATDAKDKTALPLTVTEDVTEDRLTSVFGSVASAGNIFNKGTYLLYQNDINGEKLGLTYKDNKYEFDYYLIEISWKDNVTFSDYTKETDLLYIVVNAKQPEPVEKKSESMSSSEEETVEETTASGTTG